MRSARTNLAQFLPRFLRGGVRLARYVFRREDSRPGAGAFTDGTYYPSKSAQFVKWLLWFAMANLVAYAIHIVCGAAG